MNMLKMGPNYGQQRALARGRSGDRNVDMLELQIGFDQGQGTIKAKITPVRQRG